MPLIYFQGRLIEAVTPVAAVVDAVVDQPPVVVVGPTPLETDVSTLKDSVAVVTGRVDTLWNAVMVKGTTPSA